MTGSADAASSVLALLDRHPSPVAGPHLVAIDGPAGSGKTTLAGSVTRALAALGRVAADLHLDDLYDGWSEDLGGALQRRVIEQVLDPLSHGRAASWQRYDWLAGRFTEWIELAPPEVLVVEGCGSGARAYASYRPLLVWVEAPPSTRMARGVARDGSSVIPHWLAWMESEQAHFEREGTRGRADLVLGTGP